MLRVASPLLFEMTLHVEDITKEEYDHLLKLMDGLEKPHLDDMDLYETGGHRDLYTYLTKSMGLSVQPGREPAWHRAEAIIKKYEAERLRTSSRG